VGGQKVLSRLWQTDFAILDIAIFGSFGHFVAQKVPNYSKIAQVFSAT
jgi:hypothetical protein